MAVFISAGHNTEGQRDPGAVANGLIEAEEVQKFRDMVIRAMRERHSEIRIIQDENHERLGEYLKRIQTGAGSVVIEYHLDAFKSEDARGTTAFVADDASDSSVDFATALVNMTSEVLEIPNRGVKKEEKSARKKLAIMRKAGIVALLELGFITNKEDVKALKDEEKMEKLADIHSDIISAFDKMI